MSWYRIADGRIQFRGRITREPFSEWLSTSDGSETVDAAAGMLKLQFLSKARATRRLWQDLKSLIRSTPARQALQQEGDHFAKAVASLCYAPSLPRNHVALHRLVVVPRAMIAGRSRNGARHRLWHAALLTAARTVAGVHVRADPRRDGWGRPRGETLTRGACRDA